MADQQCIESSPGWDHLIVFNFLTGFETKLMDTHNINLFEKILSKIIIKIPYLINEQNS